MTPSGGLGGGLGCCGGGLRGDNDVLNKGSNTLGSDLVGAGAPSVGNQASDLVKAAGSGCIGMYGLGSNDLGTSLGCSSLGSSGGIVADSSSINALLDNAVPLGDGSMDDRADMDDDMNGTSDWRWHVRDWRRCSQRG
jgi:hypothetical protein